MISLQKHLNSGVDNHGPVVDASAVANDDKLSLFGPGKDRCSERGRKNPIGPSCEHV